MSVLAGLYIIIAVLVTLIAIKETRISVREQERERAAKIIEGDPGPWVRTYDDGTTTVHLVEWRASLIDQIKES
jgi:hypothetical protein